MLPNKFVQFIILFLPFIALSSTKASEGTPSVIRGEDRCHYGSRGCNPCVKNVAKTFAKLSGKSKARNTFWFDPSEESLNGQRPDAFDIRDHVQGVTRIPGLDRENWVAISRSAQDIGDGAVYLAQFDQISSDGSSWKHKVFKGANSAKKFYYYRVKDTNHVGGLQALGTLLFMGTECSNRSDCKGKVQIMDVSDPSHAKIINKLEITSEYTKAGLYSSSAAGAAAVKLADGRYLIFTRGRESEKNGWFFVSHESEINANTRWQFQNLWEAKSLASNTPWYPWENFNFITECDTQDIYFVGMGTTKSRIFLYRLTSSPAFSFEYIDGNTLDTLGPLTSLRSGGGIHITPLGEFLSYVTNRHPPFKIQEFK